MEKLRDYLGIQDSSRDSMLEFIMADVEETIKNYCNLEEVPEGLLFTSYRMAVDLYRNENFGQEEVGTGTVASITEGDTSISFSKSAESDFKKTLLKNYEKTLQRYRKVAFT